MFIFVGKRKKLAKKYNKISKEGTWCVCLSAILIDSIYRKDRNFYP